MISDMGTPCADVDCRPGDSRSQAVVGRALGPWAWLTAIINREGGRASDRAVQGRLRRRFWGLNVVGGWSG